MFNHRHRHGAELMAVVFAAVNDMHMLQRGDGFQRVDHIDQHGGVDFDGFRHAFRVIVAACVEHMRHCVQWF